MTEENPLSNKRWNYAKRLSADDTTIIELVRTRNLTVEYLKNGRWVQADYKDWSSTRDKLRYEWLTTQERRNLRSYLACGQKELPAHLNREPREQYLKWICPTCKSRTIVPIIIGFPGPEDMDAATNGNVLLHGCIVNGEEPDRPVSCTRCNWYGEHVRGPKIRQLPQRSHFPYE